MGQSVFSWLLIWQWSCIWIQDGEVCGILSSFYTVDSRITILLQYARCINISRLSIYPVKIYVVPPGISIISITGLHFLPNGSFIV